MGQASVRHHHRTSVGSREHVASSIAQGLALPLGSSPRVDVRPGQTQNARGRQPAQDFAPASKSPEQRAVWRAAIRSLYGAVAKPPVRRACGDRHFGWLRKPVRLAGRSAGFEAVCGGRPLTNAASRSSGVAAGQNLHSAPAWGFIIQPCDRSHGPPVHRRARHWWWPSDVPMGAVRGVWGRVEAVG